MFAVGNSSAPSFYGFQTVLYMRASGVSQKIGKTLYTEFGITFPLLSCF